MTAADVAGEAALWAVIAAVFAAVSIAILRYDRRHRVGWLLLVPAVFGGLGPVAASLIALGDQSLPGRFGQWYLNWCWVPAIAPVLLLPLVFPDGRLPSPGRGWRIVHVTTLVGIVGFTAAEMFQEGRLEEFPQVVNPVGIPGATALHAAFPLALTGLGAGLVSIVVRWRRSTAVERAQLTWYLTAMALVAALTLAAGVVATVRNPAAPVVNVAALVAAAGVPVAVGVAITRYHLYDIDRIVSRALVYAMLTALLVGVYVGSVLVAQAVLPGRDNAVGVAASTLLVAALVQPLRRRLQAAVDRRFYRQRYDARRAIEEFSARVRREPDLQRLEQDLLGVVSSTMRPAAASLWLVRG